MKTQEQLTHQINQFASGIFPMEIVPQYPYTPEEIAQATYILINPDDLNYQLGFEKDIPAECWEFHSTNIDNLPLFIY